MQSPRASSDDTRRILDALRHLVRAIRLSARDAEAAYGLSSAQLFVLNHLSEHPEGLSLNQLAALTFTDPSSVSVVVGRLVTSGLVRRARDRSDGRRVVLTQTAAAGKLLRRATDPTQQRLIGAIDTLADAQRRSLARSLGSLVAAMGLRGSPTLFFEDAAPTRKRSSRPAAVPTVPTRSKPRAAR